MMSWNPVNREHTTGTAPQAQSMTLGAAAKTSASLIVWCRDPTCHHQNQTDPADVAQIFGPDLAVAEWRKRLVCSRCGGRDVEVLFYGTPPWAALTRGPLRRCDLDVVVSGTQRGATAGSQHVQRLRQQRALQRLP